MKSKLLKGVLWHKRHRPVVNEFRKKVLYLDLDCDELDTLQYQLRLLSRNKFNAYAVNDKDHFSHDNMGLTKSIIFGLLIIWISCEKGFNLHLDKTGAFGSEGVSRITTEAVVLSSIAILFSDYLLSALIL